MLCGIAAQHWQTSTSSAMRFLKYHIKKMYTSSNIKSVVLKELYTYSSINPDHDDTPVVLL